MAVVCLKYIDLGTGAGQLNDETLPSVYSLLPPVNYVPTNGFAHGQFAGIDAELGVIIGGGLVKTGLVNPSGVATPDFVGQTYINTANDTQWLAYGALNTEWSLVVNPARTGVVSPVGVVTPRHRGETYIDTVAGAMWLSNGTTAADWMLVPKRTVDGGTGVNSGADNVSMEDVALGAPHDPDFGGQYAFASAPALLGAPPYGTARDFAGVFAGSDNFVEQLGGVVVGGANNRVTNTARTRGVIVGGLSNAVSGSNAAVLGGGSNTASGSGAVAAGGANNVASGAAALAVGEDTGAVNAYARALGKGARTNNRGELANASFAWTLLTELAQSRMLTLGIQINTITVDDFLSTDGTTTGEDIETRTGHAYAIFGIVTGSILDGGTRITAAWRFEALVKNEGGVAAALAATFTLIHNEDGVRILVPALDVAGSTITLLGKRDQNATHNITWFAALLMTESGN